MLSVCMLADAPPTGGQWNGFLIVACFILAAAGNAALVISLFRRQDRKREIQQPLEIRHSTEFAKLADCVSRHAEASRMVAALGEAVKEIQETRADDLQRIEDNARIRSAGIYKKVDEVRQELGKSQEAARSEMEKGFKDMERAIGRLEGKLEGQG